MSIKAVIFDLDGTITEPLLDFDIIRRDMGLDKDCASILEKLSTMPDTQKQMAMEILDSHEKTAAEHSILNPGARETLETLKSRSIFTGILTRNSRKCTNHVLIKHALDFDGIITREDGPVKPDAFGVLTLCRKFGVTPQSALVVGDFLHDLLTANNAGSPAVLLKTHKNAEKFAQYADFCIDRLDEIVEIIDSYKG